MTWSRTARFPSPDDVYKQGLQPLRARQQLLRLVVPHHQHAHILDEGGEVMQLTARQMGNARQDLHLQAVGQRHMVEVGLARERDQQSVYRRGVDRHGTADVHLANGGEERSGKSGHVRRAAGVVAPGLLEHDALERVVARGVLLAHLLLI